MGVWASGSNGTLNNAATVALLRGLTFTMGSLQVTPSAARSGW